MSDPVTNVEIEDVLSSIRRLISNGDRLSPSAEPAAACPKEPANRLVLTPSLRVDESHGADRSGITPPEDEPHQIMSEPEQAAEHDIDSNDGSDGESARDEANVAAAEDDAHGEAANSDALQKADEDLSAQDEQAQDEPAQDHGATEPEGDIWLDAAENTSEPDADETAQEEGSASKPAGQDETQTGTEVDASAADDSETKYAAADASLSDLEAQAAEFEAVVASRDDQWEPDGESGDEYAGGRVTPLSWGDTQDRLDEPDEEELSADPDWAEADDLASAQHEQSWAEGAMPIPPVEEWGDDSGLSLDDAILDEDALRDMVSEIVRQELQGALGERITRNVRKLVRREIHRALTSQDMD